MKWLGYDVTKLLCWLVFRFRFGLRVTGREHVPARGAFILASNHISYLDPPLMGVACPRRLVSVTVTSWSAESAFWMTTRPRAVTDEADELTSSSSFTVRRRYNLCLRHRAPEQFRSSIWSDA